MNLLALASILVAVAIILPTLARAASTVDQEVILTRTGTRLLTEEEQSALQLKITRAGMEIKPEYFQGIKAGIAGLSLILIVFLTIIFSFKALFLLLLVPVFYLLPTIWLDSRIEMRKTKFLMDLDNFVVYLSTALTSSPELIVALQEAAISTGGVYEKEILRAVKENASGKNLTDTLLDMAYRIDVEEINSLVNVINQTSIYGGSIAENMQEYADKLRENKRFAVMEQAGKLTIKLTLLVLITMVLPVLLIIGYPAIYTLIHTI